MKHINKFGDYSRFQAWAMTLILALLLTGCGGGSGGRDPVLGGSGGNVTPPPPVVPPTVTVAVPLATTPIVTGVAINSDVTATFSKDMAPATFSTTTFTLACPAGTPVAGTVSYVTASRVATFDPTADMPANTICTATITTGVTDTSNNALASNFVWTFRTSVTADTTRPRVTLTVPATTIPGPTPGIATNTAITATFSEDMDTATIAAASFTVTCAAPCTSPAGNVTYAAGARTATFAPTAALAANTTYTATITTAATDLASNALAGNQAALPAASNYVWTFTTAAAADAIPPTVTLVTPTDTATGVCLQKAINATFSEAMDPTTITNLTFTVTGAGFPVPGGTVSYDPLTRIATFTHPTSFATSTPFTATITTGVEDLAGNALAANRVWTFTTGTQPCSPVAPIALGAAAPFGNMGGTAGTTNQGTLTVINGDLGSTSTTTTTITGFHDSATPVPDIYTETGSNAGLVSGRIFTCTVSTTGPTTAVNPANCTIATNARLDAITAYNNLSPALLPGGANPGGNLANLTLAPGVYTAPAGSFLIQGGDLTLDGQGDTNAVWVFQMATTLTVGGPGAAAPQSIILTNGAQAKNIFWQVGSSATINAAGGGTMVGTILASDSVSFSTAGNVAIVTLNGRAVGLNASVTLVNTIINVPAP